MQATITYLLTEQAQRAQMAATGQPVARKQTMTIEITPDDLPLCRAAEDGSITIDTAHEHEPALVAAGWRKANPVEAISYAPDVLGDIRQGRAVLDAAFAEACQIVSQYVRDSDESMAHPENSYHLYVPYTVLPKTGILHAHPRIDTSKYDKYGIYSTDLESDAIELLRLRSEAKTRLYDEDCAAALDGLTNYDSAAHLVGNTKVFDVDRSSSPAVAAAYNRWKARKAESEAKAKAEATAREDAKTAAIDAFVAASSDAMLQQQHADGLLCRKTIIARLATAALNAAGLPEKCPNSVVCIDSACPCGDSTVDCIPPAVYARWKTLGLPDNTSVEFHRVRNCRGLEDWETSEDRANDTEYHAVVTIASGPFQFTRRIEL